MLVFFLDPEFLCLGATRIGAHDVVVSMVVVVAEWQPIVAM